MMFNSLQPMHLSDDDQGHDLLRRSVRMLIALKFSPSKFLDRDF